MDATAILDMLMQGGMGRSQQRLQRVAQGGNPLFEAAASMLQGGGSSGAGGALSGLLSQTLGGGTQAGGGGGLGNIVGALLGGGSATGGGGLAGGMSGGLIGSLASAALSQLGGRQAGGFDLNRFAAGQMETRRDIGARAQVMVRTMIMAARADGEIDAEEQAKILGRLEDAGGEARAFVQAELAKPVDVGSLVAEVDSPHMATEVYTAALFAIDVDTPGEQRFMRDLAVGLGLPEDLVRQLHQGLEVGGA